MPRSEVGEPGDPLDLPRQLHNGAGAALKIDARVRRAPFHRDGVIAHAFARGLELALQTGARFQHQHRRARSRCFFGERA